MINTGMNEIVSGGYGGGYGYGGNCGFGGVGLFGLIGLNSLGNGCGGNYGGCGCGGYGGGYPYPYDGAATRTLEQTIAMLQSQQGQTCCINDNVDDVKEALTYGFSNTKDAIYGVGTALMQMKYEQANSTCQQTNTIVNAINCGVQSIKDIMCCSREKDLERQLAVAENGGPIVRAGAFVAMNPCQNDKRMNDIEQTVVQIGNNLNAVLGALSVK